jgi:hypothetical protein
MGREEENALNIQKHGIDFSSAHEGRTAYVDFAK